MVKLLIANRGEIAVRIIQSATELGFETVAVYTNDQDKTHCQKATESVKISSFLNIKEIITVAQRVNATAIHPGYGFLSESADFAEQCERAKIIFVGPSPQCIKAMGDKVSARQVAKAAGIPVIPGIEQSISSSEVVQFAEHNGGYPVMLKARDGGGGRGIRIVHSDQEVLDALTRCTNESPSKQIFVEKAVIGAKHIEVQILGDNKNNVIHLYERDCSIQRRYQKLLEVAPCPCLSPKLRTSIHQAAIRLAHHIGYNSAGTVEFLVLPDSDVFYFLEVNPRIQVEHTISEQITQVDIVQSQIRIALGDTLADLGLSQGVIYSLKQPVAIQARIVSENPLNNNMLSVGKVQAVHFPLGHGIRIDTWIHPGCVVLPAFDSLLAKIIVTGQTFKDAVSKLKLALEETTITGVETNISFLIAVLSDTTFTSDSLSQVHVKSLEENMDSLVQVTAQLDEQRKRMVSNKRDTETATTATVPSSVQFKPGDAFNIEIVDGEEAAVHSLQIDSISINNFPDELVAITQASTHKQPLSISITKKSGISSTMRRKANSRHQAEVGAPLTAENVFA
ncbi:hypothetical protein RMATCC62417_12980 [Rhizopus microsporus]|nr:hypothetical protein RMATCC62417_12980 [Rhizopus microsporus]